MDIKGIKLLKRFHVNAIVIWPFTIYAEREVDPIIANHERIHREQIRRDGVLGFYGRYLREYLYHRYRGMNHDQAYRSISYEAEAYANQKDLDYRVS